jgi:hypothetical protein
VDIPRKSLTFNPDYGALADDLKVRGVDNPTVTFEFYADADPDEAAEQIRHILRAHQDKASR